ANRFAATRKGRTGRAEKAGVTCFASDLLRDVPQLHGAVATGGDERFAVRRETDAARRAAVTAERLHRRAVGRGPEFHAAVFVRRRDESRITRDRSRAAGALYLRPFSLVGEVPPPQPAAGHRRGERLAVGAGRERVNAVLVGRQLAARLGREPV